METRSKKKKKQHGSLDKDQQLVEDHSPEQPQKKQKRTRRKIVQVGKPEMETRYQKRQRLEALWRDRISDLPEDILHHVLSFLPIQLIARASVLSKRWNTLWLNYPHLDFSGFVPNPKPKPKKTDSKRNPNKGRSLEYDAHGDQAMAMEFLTKLLSLHNPGSVKVFRISGSRVSNRCLNECVSLLSRRHIALEELELDVDLNSNRLNLHGLLRLAKLRVLKLKSEGLTYSPVLLYPISRAFAEKVSFRSLQTLSLHKGRFTEDRTSMFSSGTFPSIRRLHMSNCWGISCLRISSPTLGLLDISSVGLDGLYIDCVKLTGLAVDNCFRKISGGTRVKVIAPSLRRFLWLRNEITDSFSVVYSGILINFMISFPSAVTKLINAEKVKSAAALWGVISSTPTLGVQHRIIEYLSGIHFAGTLPEYFNNLWSLQLDTGLSKHDMPGIVRLLRSSPVLSILKINVVNKWKSIKNHIDLVNDPDFSSEQYLESQAGSIESFKGKLRVVEIGILGQEVYETTLDLIKFLLKHGKVLQEMTITSNMEPPLPQRKISLEIMEFPRACSNAEICFPLSSMTDDVIKYQRAVMD